MSFSAPFILRPVGTGLLAIGLALAGLLAYAWLPVAPLPSAEMPTIAIGGGLPGADPETIAASVVAPLERRLGAIAGIAEMTSYSALGAFYIVLQFDLSRAIDGAARDVQAALNAAGSDLPPLPNPPFVNKFNPGSAPVMVLAMSADTLTAGAVYDAADSIVAPRIARIPGVAAVQIQGAEQPAIRVTIDPAAARAAGVGLEAVRQAIAENNITQATGALDGATQFAANPAKPAVAKPAVAVVPAKPLPAVAKPLPAAEVAKPKRARGAARI
jgi:multidrug efflux pump